MTKERILNAVPSISSLTKYLLRCVYIQHARNRREYAQMIYWLYTLSKCSWPIDGMQMYFEERNRRKAASGCERNREEREERRDRTCVKNVCTYTYIYIYTHIIYIYIYVYVYPRCTPRSEATFLNRRKPSTYIVGGSRLGYITCLGAKKFCLPI